MFYLMTPQPEWKVAEKRRYPHPYNINSSLVPKEQILDPRLLLELNSLNKMYMIIFMEWALILATWYLLVLYEVVYEVVCHLKHAWKPTFLNYGFKKYFGYIENTCN